MKTYDLFIDADVLIDIGTKRYEHYHNSINALQRALDNNQVIATSSLIIANLYYLISKELNRQQAQSICEDIMTIVEILPFHKKQIVESFESKFSDKEDGMNYFIAYSSKCDLILTRNKRDFRHSKIIVKTPAEYLKTIK